MEINNNMEGSKHTNIHGRSRSIKYKKGKKERNNYRENINECHIGTKPKKANISFQSLPRQNII